MNEPTDLIPLELKAMNCAMNEIFKVLEKRGMSIEEAITKLPGLDYYTAWEILGALQARLVSRYENQLDEKVYDLMGKLYEALGKAEEQEPHKRWDEDRIDADKGRI